MVYNCCMARKKKPQYINIQELRAKKEADERASIVHSCECVITEHDSHWGTFCPERLGIRKHYYRDKNGRVLRICDRCATQISSSRSKIL